MQTKTYKALLAFSVTEVRVAEFEATDDDDAKHKALNDIEWGEAQDAQSADTLSLEDRPEDRIITLIDISGMQPRPVNKHIELDADRPYSWDACSFVTRLANAQVRGMFALVEGEPLSLEGLIRQARTICVLPNI